jgi:hypothetical protein
MTSAVRTGSAAALVENVMLSLTDPDWTHASCGTAQSASTDSTIHTIADRPAKERMSAGLPHFVNHSQKQS